MAAADGGFGPVPDGRDPVRYDQVRRRVLWSLPTGLFVVGSRAGNRRNLMTCNWVMQIATRPKLVAVSVERGSVTRGLIEDGGGFSVSVLSRADRPLVRRFVRPVDADAVELDAQGAATSLKGEPVFEVAGGLPCLVSAVAWLSCEVRRVCCWDGDAPDGAPSHVLVVGEVVDVGETLADSGSGHPGVLRMEDTRMNYGG
ncbi:MAG TPA: flavin reductase family protein [Acidimicrobiales bacterium]|nr:flavin reductase family protein [Acidimicrobiales bacterium]